MQRPRVLLAACLAGGLLTLAARSAGADGTGWGLYDAARVPSVVAAIRSGEAVLRYQDDERFLVEARGDLAARLLASGAFTRSIAAGAPGAPYLLVVPALDASRDPAQGGEGPLVLPDAPGLAELLEAGGRHATRIPAGPLPLAELAALPVIASGPYDAYLDAISAGEFLAVVQRLQDFGSRYSFGDSIWPAGAWIADRFREIGYTEVRLDTFVVRDPTLGRNVIAVKPGLVHPERQVVIGGHYDSAVQFGHPRIWAPGADDNGSGTAMAIELARVFRDVPCENTMIFVAFAAEEQGLDGSWHYAAGAHARGDEIVLMINSDMIANAADADPDVCVYRNGASQAWADVMSQMATDYTGLVPVQLGAQGNSDHWPFMQYGYPAVMAHEGDFSGCWHKPCDTWDLATFSAPYAAEVIRMAGGTALAAAVPMTATGVEGGLAGAEGGSPLAPRAAGASLRVTPAPGSGPFTFRFSPGGVARAMPGGAADRSTLTILDAAGRVVRRIITSGRAAEVSWDGADSAGRRVPAGIYFARMETPEGLAQARIPVLR